MDTRALVLTRSLATMALLATASFCGCGSRDSALSGPHTVTSQDGTTIAYDRVGQGPAVVLVGAALQSRATNAELATLLAHDLTVFNYDRRGRGNSGDQPPYAVEREIEDLGALLAAVGGTTAVYGTSAGAVLALKAAARGLPIRKLLLWEPNFLVDDSRPPLPADYVAHLNELVAAGRRGDAVEYFLTAAVGIPAAYLAPLRAMPVWTAMEALAHTLAYDGTVVDDTLTGAPVRAETWPTVTMRTLVIDGGTTPWLTAGANALTPALPNAERQTLAGQTHDVAATAIAPTIAAFVRGD
jgi:alpha-beta hydrolase superfamily lysophospholipase